MITSTHNPRVQWVRSLQSQPQARREHQAFVVEGVRLVEEALEAGWLAQLVFYTEDLPPRGQKIVDAYQEKGVKTELVAPHVLKAAADTGTPQGILAVLPIQRLPLPQHAGLVLIADGVRDPGNLGTILRTACAAGVDAVLLPPGSTDAFAPKVVRAGMGAHMRISIHTLEWRDIEDYLFKRELPLKVYLADASGGMYYTSADLRAPLALIIGGEAEGAGSEARSLAVESIHIPMPGKIESLNAAVATAILLFEVVRQRSYGPEQDRKSP